MNLLCQKAGFDMKNHLSDDGETYDGERGVANRDWRGCVLMAIACVGTILINGNLIGIGINKPYKPKPIADLLRKHGGKTKKKLEAAGK